tara:strand:- start:531 stop:770 length:240 start_codon:yes stop_codon:yes gene_type:complete
MKQSKLNKQKKSKLNNGFAVEGRTKQQRKNNAMRAAINSFEGIVVGDTLKDKYSHMHRQIANDRAEQRRLKEEKLQEEV